MRRTPSAGLIRTQQSSFGLFLEFLGFFRFENLVQLLTFFIVCVLLLGFSKKKTKFEEVQELFIGF